MIACRGADYDCKQHDGLQDRPRSSDQRSCGLTSADALAAFLSRLGYDTGRRTVFTPSSLGLSGDTASSICSIELLSEDEDKFLRVLFAQPKSLTAKVRNDLVRVLGKSNLDHLLILASDFDTLEFVFLDKQTRRRGPAGGDTSRSCPRRSASTGATRPAGPAHAAAVHLDAPGRPGAVRQAPQRLRRRRLHRRILPEPGPVLRLLPAGPPGGRPRLAGQPLEMFAFVRDLFRGRPGSLERQGQGHARDAAARTALQETRLQGHGSTGPEDRRPKPDYLLNEPTASKLTAAFVYAWDRWLDGPDLNDADTPEENPGACVVTALDEGMADWIIVTNGRLWRLYSRQAHARATNFYEVDLVEALTASGDTDPNEAFRYWWLFLRPAAFKPKAEGQRLLARRHPAGQPRIRQAPGRPAQGPHLPHDLPASGAGLPGGPQAAARPEQGPTDRGRTGRHLRGDADAALPAALPALRREPGPAADPGSAVPARPASRRSRKRSPTRPASLRATWPSGSTRPTPRKETTLYDRLCKLFEAMDKGDPILNVPTYNGGLFNTTPDKSDRRDQRIARFLLDHKVPDRYLALAIDRLARDQDERTLGLVFIDYKSLEVRHLGSIYEGLLEFKLKVADEDLTTQADKKGEKYIPLSQAKAKRGKQADVVVRKREVYLSNDKAERKASGSYYTPDPIVEYIVAHTVGPVLEEKLEALRPEFRKVRKTFDNELKSPRRTPARNVKSGTMDHRQWAGRANLQHPQGPGGTTLRPARCSTRRWAAATSWSRPSISSPTICSSSSTSSRSTR